MEQEKTKKIIYQILNVLLSLLVSALVLMIASSLFEAIEISSFWVAICTAAVISLLNSFIKPILIFMTLPITISTLGLFYPIINVLILKFASVIVGPEYFMIKGFIAPVFIALFISMMNIVLDKIIVKPITKGR